MLSKTARSARSAVAAWDEDTLLEAINQSGGARQAHSAKAVLDWFTQRGATVWFGRSPTWGSATPTFRLPDGRQLYTVAVWGQATIELQFQHLMDPPFDDALREEIAGRLEAIPGLVIPRERIRKRPNFPLSLIASDEALDAFLRTLEWWLAVAQNGGTAGMRNPG
jgi:hypothetical protein